MLKYGGKVIFAAHDADGVIEVVEDRFLRSLHFGTSAKQSSVDPADPVRLVLSYTRAMTAALLFAPQPPHRALLVGLGGGSLARFLLHHFPDCEVDAVEYRDAVHRLARRFFHLPDEPRLTVYIAEAGEHLAAAAAEPRYDLILIDAFVAEGVADAVCRRAFLDHCRRRLAPGGALAMNLWAPDATPNGRLLWDLEEAFDQPPLCLPVEGRENVVMLTAAAPLTLSGRPLDRCARALGIRLDVEYPALLRTLRKANRHRT